jgi:hypothetical protein
MGILISQITTSPVFRPFCIIKLFINKQAARLTENHQKIRGLTNIAEVLQIYYKALLKYQIYQWNCLYLNIILAFSYNNFILLSICQ